MEYLISRVGSLMMVIFDNFTEYSLSSADVGDGY
jgi:hypothetical protein